MTLSFSTDRGTAQQLVRHLQLCDASFCPPLSSRINLRDYAEKLSENATQFEAWSENELVGLVAMYCNDQNRVAAFISNVSVIPAFTGQGIANQLMVACIERARGLDFSSISLEVSPRSRGALHLYEKLGFHQDSSHTTSDVSMVLVL